MAKYYVVPLRKAREAPKSYRARKAIKILRQFLQRHLKGNHVRIGQQLNNEIWKHGARKPPSSIRISASREAGVIKATLAKLELPKPEFECAECTKKFSSKQGLKIHKTKKHKVRGKEFECDQCEKSFKSKRGLKIHKGRKHKPKFKCEKCGKKFDSKQGLKIHIGKVH